MHPLFSYAKRKKIPILTFIRNRNVATKPNERETDINKQVKLDRFVNKVSKNKICEFWDTGENL